MTNDVAVKPTAETGPELVARVRGTLAEMLADCPTEGEGIGAASILDRILSAPNLASVAEVFEGLDSSSDLVGKRFTVNGFTLRESDYGENDPETAGVYATVYATSTDGERDLTFNSGAGTVLAVLALAWHRKAFPFTATMVAKDIRKTGRRAYNLIPEL